MTAICNKKNISQNNLSKKYDFAKNVVLGASLPLYGNIINTVGGSELTISNFASSDVSVAAKAAVLLACGVVVKSLVDITANIGNKDKVLAIASAAYLVGGVEYAANNVSSIDTMAGCITACVASVVLSKIYDKTNS